MSSGVDPDLETGFELTLGSLRGCVMIEGESSSFGTVAEARVAILQYAMDLLDHHAHQPEKRQYLRLNVRADGPTWDDLAECEESRRYDPGRPEEGMKCSYFLYRQGGLEGVGDLMWTYSVTIWATAPPQVWDHPADEPVGLDADDGLKEQPSRPRPQVGLSTRSLDADDEPGDEPDGF